MVSALKKLTSKQKKGKDKVNNYSGKAEKIEKDVNGTKKVAYKFATGKDNALYFLQVKILLSAWLTISWKKV